MAEPYYTTAADLRTELGLDLTAMSDAAALVLIQRAEDRIDGLLGGRPVDETTLRKVVEADVESWQWGLLGRATVVLAALLYGTPNLLTQPRYRREKGPDFELEDPLGGVIPDTVLGPLNGSGLRVLSGRALPGGSRGISPDLRSTWGEQVRAANCTVTSVIAPGGLDDYGDPATGTVAWTGRVDGYMRRPRKGGHPVGGTGSDRENDQRLDELVVPALGADTFQRALTSGAAAEASRVTVEDRRTGTVVERTYELVGLDARVGGTVADSVRLLMRREA